jgi:uncharacterized protein (UPF0248 family)
MIPIQELLNKLKWDPNEEPFSYSVFYYDRVANMLREVKYRDIVDVRDGYMTFVRQDSEVMIPLHRIRVVKRAGVTVWDRKLGNAPKDI